MASKIAVKQALGQRFEKVSQAPLGFDLYVSIHDFVDYIESTPAFGVFLKGTKAARAGEIPVKYVLLKQVHQGIKDIDLRTTTDLGHDRYVAIRELSLIRKQDLSGNNSFWKRREAFKKITGDVYKVLDAYLEEIK